MYRPYKKQIGKSVKIGYYNGLLSRALSRCCFLMSVAVSRMTFHPRMLSSRRCR